MIKINLPQTGRWTVMIKKLKHNKQETNMIKYLKSCTAFEKWLLIIAINLMVLREKFNEKTG